MNWKKLRNIIFFTTLWICMVLLIFIIGWAFGFDAGYEETFSQMGIYGLMLQK